MLKGSSDNIRRKTTIIASGKKLGGYLRVGHIAHPENLTEKFDWKFNRDLTAK